MVVKREEAGGCFPSHEVLWFLGKFAYFPVSSQPCVPRGLVRGPHRECLLPFPTGRWLPTALEKFILEQ